MPSQNIKKITPKFHRNRYWTPVDATIADWDDEEVCEGAAE